MQQTLWSKTWHDIASPELTQALTEIGVRRRLVDGELLYRQGAPGSELIGIESGVIQAVNNSPDGHEGLVGLYMPGTWFGEVSLFDDMPRPVTTYAVGETWVLVVSAVKLRALLDKNPIWYRDFARVICNKLRAALAHIESSVQPMSVRIAKRLIDLSQVYGVACEEGLLINLKLPQDDLARMLGLTRQSVNKELRAFEEQGLLRLQAGRITLRDPDRLQALIANPLR